MTDDDHHHHHHHHHRRENDHLVEPMYHALPPHVAPRAKRVLRSGLWCLVILAVALALKLGCGTQAAGPAALEPGAGGGARALPTELEKSGSRPAGASRGPAQGRPDGPETREARSGSGPAFTDGRGPGAAAAPRARDAGLLEGEVHDDAGRPVRAFTVRWASGGLIDLETKAQKLEVEHEAGRFALAVPPEGLWLSLSARGHVASAPDWVRPSASGRRLWTLVRAAAVRGVVLDGAGAPVPGANVVRASLGTTRDARPSGAVRADDRGRFRIEVPPSGFELAAFAAGHAWSEPRAVSGTPGAELSVELVLREPGRIEGEVRGDDGQPVAAARVWLDDVHAAPSEVAADGTFFVADVAPGRHRIGADFETVSGADRRARSVSARIDVRSGETTRVVLTSRPARPIEIVGSVHRAGPPVTGRVSLHPELGRYSLRDVPLTQGRFSASVDGPGVYLVQVWPSPGDVYQRRVVVPDEPTFEVEITLSGASIAGVVLDADGRPAPGIAIGLAADARHADLAGDASVGRAVSDAAGRFAFESVRPGVYSLTFPAGVLAADVARECLRDLDVREGVARDDLELRLRAAGVVRGVVRGTDGTPHAAAEVRVLDEAGLPAGDGAVRSGAVGGYLVRAVRPGPVRVVALAPDAAAVSAAAVDVPAGGVATLDLYLVACGSIAVNVFERPADGTGTPRRVGAALRLEDGSGIDFALLSGVTRRLDGDGRDVLLVERVPPGSYTLRALNHSGGHVAREVRIEAGTESEASLVFE